jgi:hypothetical protein
VVFTKTNRTPIYGDYIVDLPGESYGTEKEKPKIAFSMTTGAFAAWIKGERPDHYDSSGFDPLACPQCGGQMKVIAFFEPPQGGLIEKILRHCGLWHSSSAWAPPPEDGSVHDTDRDRDRQKASDEPRELTFVDEDTF